MLVTSLDLGNIGEHLYAVSHETTLNQAGFLIDEMDDLTIPTGWEIFGRNRKTSVSKLLCLVLS
jgi:hypothetical protein